MTEYFALLVASLDLVAKLCLGRVEQKVGADRKTGHIEREGTFRFPGTVEPEHQPVPVEDRFFHHQPTNQSNRPDTNLARFDFGDLVE
uniref:Putative secreted protein n=1 Tax=Anopheles triannulatus TaxID=58253 RepID=A0A2M4B6G3_9DIPT